MMPGGSLERVQVIYYVCQENFDVRYGWSPIAKADINKVSFMFSLPYSIGDVVAAVRTTSISSKLLSHDIGELHDLSFNACRSTIN